MERREGGAVIGAGVSRKMQTIDAGLHLLSERRSGQGGGRYLGDQRDETVRSEDLGWEQVRDPGHERSRFVQAQSGDHGLVLQVAAGGARPERRQARICRHGPPHRRGGQGICEHVDHGYTSTRSSSSSRSSSVRRARRRAAGSPRRPRCARGAVRRLRRESRPRPRGRAVLAPPPAVPRRGCRMRWDRRRGAARRRPRSRRIPRAGGPGTPGARGRNSVGSSPPRGYGSRPPGGPSRPRRIRPAPVARSGPLQDSTPEICRPSVSMRRSRPSSDKGLPRRTLLPAEAGWGRRRCRPSRLRRSPARPHRLGASHACDARSLRRARGQPLFEAFEVAGQRAGRGRVRRAGHEEGEHALGIAGGQSVPESAHGVAARRNDDAVEKGRRPSRSCAVEYPFAGRQECHHVGAGRRVGDDRARGRRRGSRRRVVGGRR